MKFLQILMLCIMSMLYVTICWSANVVIEIDESEMSENLKKINEYSDIIKNKSMNPNYGIINKGTNNPNPYDMIKKNVDIAHEYFPIKIDNFKNNPHLTLWVFHVDNVNQRYCLVDCSQGQNNCWYRLYNSGDVFGNPDVQSLSNFNGYLDQQIGALITVMKQKLQNDQSISDQVKNISSSQALNPLEQADIITHLTEFDNQRKNLIIQYNPSTDLERSVKKNMVLGLKLLPIVNQCIYKSLNTNNEYEFLFVTYLPYDAIGIKNLTPYYIAHVKTKVVSSYLGGGQSVQTLYSVMDINNPIELKADVRTLVNQFYDTRQFIQTLKAGLLAKDESISHQQASGTYQSYLENGSRYSITSVTKNSGEEISLSNKKYMWNNNDNNIKVTVNIGNGKTQQLDLPDKNYKQKATQYTLKDYSFVTNLLGAAAAGGLLGALFDPMLSMVFQRPIDYSNAIIPGAIGLGIGGYFGYKKNVAPDPVRKQQFKSVGFNIALSGVAGAVVGAGLGGYFGNRLLSSGLLGTSAGILLYSLMKKVVYIESTPALSK